MNNLQQENFALRRELIRSQQAYLIQQRQLNDLQMEKLNQLSAELTAEEKMFKEPAEVAATGTDELAGGYPPDVPNEATQFHE